MSVTSVTGLETLRTSGVKRPSPRLEAVTEDLVLSAHGTGDRGRLHRYWRRDPALVGAVMMAHPLNLAGAAGLGRFKEVKRLLEAGDPVDAVDAEGWTPLMRAARSGHTGIVALLLAAGADVKRASPSGRTALMCAQERGHADVIVQLSMAGAFGLGAAEAHAD